MGEELGFTPLDWRTKTEEKRERLSADKAITSDNKHLSQEERHIAKRDTKGGSSWKDALRQTIDEAKVNCTDRAEFQHYLQDNYGVTMPRNTAKTVSFVHPAVGEGCAVRGTKLDKALWENKERSVLNAGLFISQDVWASSSRRERPAEEKQSNTNSRGATSTYADTNIETFISQPTSQTGNGNRLAPRSIGDVGAELRSLDETVQSITGRNQSNGEPVDRLAEKGTTEKPRTTETSGEYERSIQQKPKRRSHSYER